MRRPLVPLLVLLAGLVLAPPTVHAQERGRSFVLLRGSDTVAIEAVRERAGGVTGELLVLVAASRFRYELWQDADRRPDSLATAVYRASDSATATPSQSARFRFGTDSIRVEVIQGIVARDLAAEARPGLLPYLNPSMRLLEDVLRQALAQGGDSARVELLPVETMRTVTVELRRREGDTVQVGLGGAELRFAVGPDGRLRGGVIPAQGLRLEVLDTLLAVTEEHPDYSAPAGAPYAAIEVRVPGPDSVTLAGTLTVPSGASARRRVPAVITISGSGPQDRDEAIPAVRGYRPFREVADALGRRGIAVLRLDDRGTHGSTGSFALATTADFAADVRAALAWLRARPEIDPARIALLGHSEGALVAPMVAVTDRRLRGLVLLAAPAWDGHRVLDFQVRDALARDTALAPAARDSAFARARAQRDSAAALSPWLRFFVAHDPAATARRVRVPVLIQQGETDRQVSPAQADELAAAFRAGGNRDVTTRRYPATNHLFLADDDGSPAGYAELPSRGVRPEVLRDAAEWLARRLRP